MWTERDYIELVMNCYEADEPEVPVLLNPLRWLEHLGGLNWLSDYALGEGYYLPHILNVWDNYKPRPSTN